MSDRGIHFNDIDHVFKITILDEDGDVVDVSGVTEKYIKFQKPDGTTVTQTAAFLTDGTNGIITYTSVDGDLDQDGGWKMQPYLVGLGTWTGHSETIEFEVFPVL